MPKRKHILVADDEAAFRFSASLALRIAGFRVSEATGGMDALRRNDVPVPVFVVSGNCDPGALRELAAAGCVEYMEKPFQPAELVGRIDNIFKANVA